MNGSENSYASALFFVLISFGALLKIQDVTSYAIGAGAAILAAICLRNALIKSAQAAEENHQRMEIQFQQLRSKIVETSSASLDAMNSLNETTKLFKENLQILREQSANMDNFLNLLKDAESINSAIAELEENSFALNAALEKFFIAIQSQEKFPDLTAELEKIFIAIQSQEKFPDLTAELENIRVAIQSQEKFPDLTAELENIRVAIQSQEKFPDMTPELKNLAAIESANNKNLAALVKINNSLSKSVAVNLDNLRLEVAKLSDKLDKLGGTATEDQTPLTEEDVDLLKKIVAKINLK